MPGSGAILSAKARKRRTATVMHLSDHDLRQFDDAYLERLTATQARVLLGKALADLKAARERLGQNPSNSSRPPSTRLPWEGRGGDETPADNPDVTAGLGDPDADAGGSGGPDESAAPKPRRQGSHRTVTGQRPGRRPGAPGHSRTRHLPVDAELPHRPSCCAGCSQSLNAACESRAHNARYEIELIQPGAGATGLLLQQTKHIYFESRCGCGHWTQAQPGRCPAEPEWTVALTEWHLAGPRLVAFICALSQRMRLSRARIGEFLSDWLGLEISTATIDQCIHEAGRAVAPVVEAEIQAAVRDVELLYADETTWKEHGRLLWLWVFTCATATLFVVGKRSVEVVRQVLGETFHAWLMSDGFWAYRGLDRRLRCLAHLIRKAQALEDGLEPAAQAFGTHLLTVIATVIHAVYEARAAPPPAGALYARHRPMLNALLEECRRQVNAPHAKTRALARELLNDWNTFWVVLDHPELPLTNNEAERALRHWVIARRIGMGTRTAQGTRAFAHLASVIETCRKRGASPWAYLAEVIRLRRQGLQAPPLPSSAS
jgi:transposase